MQSKLDSFNMFEVICINCGEKRGNHQYARHNGHIHCRTMLKYFEDSVEDRVLLSLKFEQEQRKKEQKESEYQQALQKARKQMFGL